jgi:hypothetical protein
MQNCFYHTQSDATTTCIGCKMPICEGCQGVGKKGFCESCLKKVASLGEKIQDMKKTGMVNNMKATMIKSSSRPTSLKNVTYCFQHFDVVAGGTCPTCNRPYCPTCLDPSGLCTHCAALEEEVEEEAPAYAEPVRQAPSAGPRPVSRPAAARAREAKKAKKTPVFFYVGAALLILFVGFNLTKRGSTPRPAVEGANSKTSVLAHGAPAAGGEGPVSVAIAAPASGETVSGIATIKADVTGAPERVEFMVDGEWQASVSAPPYQFQWASQAVPNGNHRVTLVALHAGNKVESTIDLTVKN